VAVDDTGRRWPAHLKKRLTNLQKITTTLPVQRPAGADAGVNEQVIAKRHRQIEGLEKPAMDRRQGSPERLGQGQHAAPPPRADRRIDAIAGQGVLAAEGEPSPVVGGRHQKGAQGGLVIAFQEMPAHRRGAQPGQTIQHRPARRSTVDIIAKNHPQRAQAPVAGTSGVALDLKENPLKQIGPTVNVTDRVKPQTRRDAAGRR